MNDGGDCRTAPATPGLLHTYPCATCDQELIYINYLKRHMKIHTEGNLYKCALCGEGFISKKNLKNSNGVDNQRPGALCAKEISINHPKRHNISHSWKFHRTVLSSGEDNFLSETTS